jgi:hypothetical protein
MGTEPGMITGLAGSTGREVERVGRMEIHFFPFPYSPLFLSFLFILLSCLIPLQEKRTG